VTQAVGGRAIGVILTGMGRDGAEGLLTLRNAGAETLGQDEQSSVVYGMPKVAFEMGAVAKQLPLDRIGETLVRLANAHQSLLQRT
jgi:two-component system chemotaxis response regulator CheB